jgi:hypothetical protein
VHGPEAQGLRLEHILLTHTQLREGIVTLLVKLPERRLNRCKALAIPRWNNAGIERKL